MKITLKSLDFNNLDADVLIAFVFQKEILDFPEFKKDMLDVVKNAIKKENFQAKNGQNLVLSSNGLISSYKIVLVGCGKEEDLTAYKIMEFVSWGFKQAMINKGKVINFIIPGKWFEKISVQKVYQLICESIILTGYKFNKYKKEKIEDIEVEEVKMVIPPGKMALAEKGLQNALISSEAVCIARDLVNEPASVTTPTFLAKKAESIAKRKNSKIKVDILEKGDLEKLNMNAFLGVAKGSQEDPKFIRLSYKPLNAKKKIVLIGKGITFDTGGLSLKDAVNMESMKCDMAGAAGILGIFSVIEKSSIKNEVIGYIPACENMPSGHALHPGDILHSMSGKTIEVLNTDAEGRLTLADTITYSQVKDKPSQIIDLATLTGACMVALGQDIAGLSSNDEKLILNLKEAAKNSGEKVWVLPCEKDYKKLLESKVADIKNIATGRYGGAITAALFLEEFVENTPWAHFDIAGPAFAEKSTSYIPYGGTGFGVRTLLNYLQELT